MMVQQLKEDQAGKTEEELSECFRIFDKYVTGFWLLPILQCTMHHFYVIDIITVKGVY